MFLSQLFVYHSPFQAVSEAVFRKYPNPFAQHVYSNDVISRTVDDNGNLCTTRLFLKKGSLPKWAKKLWNVGDVWVLEQSIVDPITLSMKTITRNLSHTKLMLVEETQIIKPHPINVSWTQVEASARIISNVSWSSLRSSVERYGFYKGKDNMIRSSNGLKHVIENLKMEKEKMKDKIKTVVVNKL
ncbi:hypothetical protein HDU92_007627 [Lobulomyces angularis]|nr:hypothetical protein HDU92_007627 [Lobulomyces angularis]